MSAKVIDKDHGFARIMATMQEQAGTAYVKCGILGAGDDTRGGLHIPGEKLTVAEYAVVNEFGTIDGKIPARSFVRSTYDRMRPELESDSAKLAGKVIDGRLTTEQALNVLGAKLASGMHSTITDGAGVPPPNAPSVMARKIKAGQWNKGGLAQAAGWGVRPLVNTGRLLNSISWGVFTSRAGRRPVQYVEPAAIT